MAELRQGYAAQKRGEVHEEVAGTPQALENQWPAVRVALASFPPLDAEALSAKIEREAKFLEQNGVTSPVHPPGQIGALQGLAGKGGRKKGINGRMLDMLSKNHEAIGWTCSRWAKELKCAPSSVVETRAWQDLKMGRERRRAERALDRRRRPKGSDQRRE